MIGGPPETVATCCRVGPVVSNMVVRIPGISGIKILVEPDDVDNLMQFGLGTVDIGARFCVTSSCGMSSYTGNST